MNDRPSLPPSHIARRGLMLVLSSPSGAGKSTIARALLQEDTALRMSISATTRPPRPGEVDGRDYVFVDHPRFEAMVRDGELLEHAVVFGNRYGTPRAPVEAALATGSDVLFDVDWQGADQLRANVGGDLVAVFILPPSKAELERRLRGRAQDPEDVVRRRMEMATAEISHWDEYEYVVVNEQAERAIAQVRSILTAERLRRRRQPGLQAFVGAIGSG